MDVLAAYQGRACATLNEIACLLGLPGKLGMSGGDVWDRYQQGDVSGIRDYCETDVLNTYLIYQRFELIRGRLTDNAYTDECARLREYLQSEDKPHFNEFLEVWLSS